MLPSGFFSLTCGGTWDILIQETQSRQLLCSIGGMFSDCLHSANGLSQILQYAENKIMQLYFPKWRREIKWIVSGLAKKTSKKEGSKDGFKTIGFII